MRPHFTLSEEVRPHFLTEAAGRHVAEPGSGHSPRNGTQQRIVIPAEQHCRRLFESLVWVERGPRTESSNLSTAFAAGHGILVGLPVGDGRPDTQRAADRESPPHDQRDGIDKQNPRHRLTPHALLPADQAVPGERKAFGYA